MIESPSTAAGAGAGAGAVAEPDSPATPVERWRDSIVVQSLLILIATRLLVAGVAWFTLRIQPRLPPYPAQLPDEFLPGTLVLNGLARWDAAHYVEIALRGYGGAGNLSHDGGLGFFPLFPLLMRGLVAISGLAPTEARLAVAAIVVANACFVVAVPLFARLVTRRFDAEVARTAVLLLCISPFSYFFTVGYSESLFLLLIVLAFTCTDRRWWLAAGAVAGLASATRLAGLALLPALLVLAWRREASPRDLLGIGLLSPLGTVAYFLWTWWRFDDPLAYFTAQENWGGWYDHVGFYVHLFAGHPTEALRGDPRHLVIVLNVALLAIWLTALRPMWKRLDPGIALFSTSVIVAHGVMTWVSLGRYLLPAIGFYIVAAIWLSEPGPRAWLRDVIVVCSTILMTMLAALYAHGFWAI